VSPVVRGWLVSIDRLFESGGSLGLAVTAHAGELGDVSNVWWGVDTLGAQQVGHGVA
jgi:adenosine deaminase